MKSLQEFILDIVKKVLKHIQKCNRPRIAETIFKKKKLSELYILDFNTYDDATVFKSMWYWLKDRQTDQNNRIWNLDIHSLLYSKLNCYRNATAVKQGKKSLYGKSVCP